MMKKIAIAFLFVALCSGMSYAQRDIRVAMSQPIVLEGNASLFETFAFSTNIEKAFTNNGIRVTARGAVVDAIIKDFDFEVSGVLTNADKAKLAQLDDADYICMLAVVEKYGQYIFQAKLIDKVKGENHAVVAELVEDKSKIFSVCEKMALDLLTLIAGPDNDDDYASPSTSPSHDIVSSEEPTDVTPQPAPEAVQPQAAPQPAEPAPEAVQPQVAPQPAEPAPVAVQPQTVPQPAEPAPVAVQPQAPPQPVAPSPVVVQVQVVPQPVEPTVVVVQPQAETKPAEPAPVVVQPQPEPKPAEPAPMVVQPQPKPKPAEPAPVVVQPADTALAIAQPQEDLQPVDTTPSVIPAPSVTQQDVSTDDIADSKIDMGAEYVEKTLGLNMRFVRVDGGTFNMGCDLRRDNKCEKDETPPHSVTLSTYYIAVFEVTQGQWQRVMGTTLRQQRNKTNVNYPLRGEGLKLPMYYVSWQEANTFAARLSRMTGLSYQLPTEAQWEYAAKGGSQVTSVKKRRNVTCDEEAWYSENSEEKVHPVGRKKANILGVYDMSGNVWEWCLDWYGNYGSGAQVDPQGPSSGNGHVIRGGYWGGPADYCRSSNRGSGVQDFRGDFIGFRLVMVPSAGSVKNAVDVKKQK